MVPAQNGQRLDQPLGCDPVLPGGGLFRGGVEAESEGGGRVQHAGALRIEKGDLDLAIEDFNQAVRLNPKMAVAFDNRGLAWGRKKEYDKAIADYNEAIRLDPKLVNAWNNRAWEEATAQEDRTRNGKKAVADASKALELAGAEDDPTILTTLAAANAEAGDFANAVKWQTRAVELASSAAQKSDWLARLELYRNRQAYRDN